jgi:RimJ/RimL family protein N-acetyltransferase
MDTPTISTRRLSLRPLTKSTPRQIGWLADPDVVRYSEQRHGMHNLKSQLRYVDSFAGKSHLWGIHVVATGDHIGNLSAVHDPYNDVSDVGILIGEKNCWKLGMGLEAWSGACDWLLDPLCGGIRKLEAGCMRDNVAMMKILAGSKFKFEGERLNHFLLDGRPVGMVLFGRHR